VSSSRARAGTPPTSRTTTSRPRRRKSTARRKNQRKPRATVRARPIANPKQKARRRRPPPAARIAVATETPGSSIAARIDEALFDRRAAGVGAARHHDLGPALPADVARDRKSTRLNSSHVAISYAVFCLKKK